jgi:serine/threonine protein kinase/tetratricopeptide (TPR) repeat protein
MIEKRWAGHFEILKPLGEGREGRVFVARDLRDKSEVALKLLHRLPDRLDKLEGVSLRQVRHPHLVRVLDVGVHEKRAYLIQEWIPGGSLRDSSLPLDGKALEALAEQLLAALGFLHGQGILHGDVKPENIFVNSAAPWEFKLGDFGLSRRSVDVSTGVTRGTPAFMPPEIIRGEPDDERSDLYALGITLYECAFGELPFRATDLRELFAQQLNESPERLARPGNIAGSILRLLRGLLSKDPALRPRSAAAARSLLHGEPAALQDWVPPRLGVLIGCEPERQQLSEALQGERSSFSIGGPEGIGKSRLLREFALDVQLQGTTPWYWDEEGLHGPSGNESLQTDRESFDQSGLAAAQAQELGRVLGQGSWLLIVDQFDSRTPQFRDALAMVVRDQASRPSTNQLICIAGRESAAAFLQSTLSQAGLPEAASIILQPWEAVTIRAAVAALLGATQLDDAIVALIESATGGVPSGVESVVRQLVDAKALRVDAQGSVALGIDVQPQDLHGHWLHSALTDLESRQRDALRLLAILRSLAPQSFLDGILGFASQAVLRRLYTRGLVRGVTRQERVFYRTSHEGIQQAVLAEMTVAEKSQLHDAVAQALEKTAAQLPEEDVAWHRCCGSDLSLAYAALEELRERLSGARPDLIQRACQNMLAAWPSDHDRANRARVEMELVRTMIQGGEFEPACDRCEAAIAGAADPQVAQGLRNLWSDALSALGLTQESLEVIGDPQGDRAGLEAKYRQAIALTELGRLDEALQICNQLQDALDSGDELADHVLEAKVAILRELEQLEQVRTLLNAAIARISKSKRQTALGVLLLRLGQVEFGRGQMMQARKLFEAALREAQRTGDRVLMARTMTGLGITQAESGEFTAAHDTFLGAFDLLRRLGEFPNATNILGNLGQMLSVLGLYGKSFDYATRGVELALQHPMRGSLFRIRIIRAGVLAKLGAEREVLAELHEVLKTSESERYQGQVLAVRAELQLYATHDSDTDQILQEALELFKKHEIEDEQFRVLLLVAQRYQLAGDHANGLEVVDRVSRGAARLHLPDLVVESEILRAELLSIEQAELALERLTKTLVLARELKLRESIWRGEALLAMLRGKEAPSIAVEHYQKCLDLFREMTEGLPKAMVNSYLARPRQKRVLTELRGFSDRL